MVPPTLVDYDSACRHWSWETERASLAGLPLGRGLNIAHEAVDRHVTDGHGDRLAFVFLSRSAARRAITYSQLAALSNRVAGALVRLGVQPGDRVFTLMDRRLELYITALGTLKAGATYSALFSSFGPEPIRARLEIGKARVLVTTPSLYFRKVKSIRDALPRLEQVILVTDPVSGEPHNELPDHALSFASIIEAAPESFEIPPTDPQSPALLHFTSGTTGTPKGALHVHEAAVVHRATGHLALDLRPEDVYWCTADPGWVTGISYGLVAPLIVGATAIVDREDFEAERWYDILSSEAVNVWYTAPTAIRMLRRSGPGPAGKRHFPQLRHIASVGEPLDPESVRSGIETFGLPVHDTWWQTETGGIMIANFRATDNVPGSMGRPFPGIEAAVVRRRGRSLEIVDASEQAGELALRSGWPSMFRTYVGAPSRYRECFADGWYLSGDLVRRDENGCYWFVGRVDDAIQSAGHLVGPFEVERVMMEHPAVADVVAFGKPDPIAYEIVAACVVLKTGYEAVDTVRLELLAHGRRRLGPAVAPREITFLPELPKTPSGKTLRRLLRHSDS